MSAKNTEKQKYTVIRTEKDFEIRFYPSATLATVYSEATTYRELSGPGFRQLARYIFGGNTTETRIPMTAPVHMEFKPSGSSMSFVMPSAYDESNLPRPDDPGVIISKTKDEYVAVVTFGGFASDADIRHHAERLKNLLGEKGIATVGQYRFLGYNPPYQLFNRRNEIIVTILFNG